MQFKQCLKGQPDIMNESDLLLPTETRLHLAVKLYNEGLFGIMENPNDYIKLKSQRRSPHYLDIRPGISDDKVRMLIARNMLNLALKRVRQQNEKATKLNHLYRHIAGNPEAMTSYMPKIAELGHISLLQPRAAKKETGNKIPVLGTYRHGDRVAMFNDVVTEGESVIEAVDRLVDTAALFVIDYFVVLDREEGGSSVVKEKCRDLEITPALAMSGMVHMLHAESLINNTQYDNVREYVTEYGEPQAKEILGIAT